MYLDVFKFYAQKTYCYKDKPTNYDINELIIREKLKDI